MNSSCSVSFACDLRPFNVSHRRTSHIKPSLTPNVAFETTRQPSVNTFRIAIPSYHRWMAPLLGVPYCPCDALHNKRQWVICTYIFFFVLFVLFRIHFHVGLCYNNSEIVMFHYMYSSSAPASAVNVKTTIALRTHTFIDEQKMKGLRGGVCWIKGPHTNRANIYDANNVCMS